MIRPADKMSHITYAIRDVVLEAKKREALGKKVTYLNVGDPLKYDFITPRHLIDAVQDSWHKSGSYADAHGITQAREAVAKEYSRQGIDNIDRDDILITTGGSEGIMMATAALLNRGEHILSPRPGYPLYHAAERVYDADIHTYDLDEEQDWQPDIDHMRSQINDRTRALLLINPNNPTGAVYTRSTLKKVLDLAGEHDLPVFADETYDKIIFDDEKFTATGSLATDVPVVTFGTLSKNYLCPGWRIGWTVFSGEGVQEYKGAVSQLARARLSAPHPLQYAVKAALEGPQDHLDELRAKLQKRRDITYRRLNEIDGISCVKSKGAFYAFPKVEVDDDKKFVLDLLREKGPLFVFGSGFGSPGHFRVVFAASEKALEESYDKLEEFMRSYS